MKAGNPLPDTWYRPQVINAVSIAALTLPTTKLMVRNYIEMQNLPLVLQLFYVKPGANIQKALSSILTIKILKRKGCIENLFSKSSSLYVYLNGINQKYE